MGHGEGVTGLHNIMVGRVVVLLVIAMAKKDLVVLRATEGIPLGRPCLVSANAESTTCLGVTGLLQSWPFWRRFNEACLGLQQCLGLWKDND